MSSFSKVRSPISSARVAMSVGVLLSLAAAVKAADTPRSEPAGSKSAVPAPHVRAKATPGTPVVIRRELPAIAPVLRGLQEAKTAKEFVRLLEQLQDALALSPFDPGALASGDRRFGDFGDKRAPQNDISRMGASDRTNAALTQKRPRGLIVEPPAGKADSDTLVRQDGRAGQTTTTAEQTDENGRTTVTSVTVDSSGAPVGTKVAHYDARGNLTDWTTWVRNPDGSSILHRGEVVSPGERNTDVVISFYYRNADGSIGEVDRATRPHRSAQGDPPATLYERRQRAGWMPLDESRGKESADWCNPISGQCRNAGKATSSVRVNPGRELDAGRQGPRIKLEEPEVNPDPDRSKHEPKPIDRTAVAPPGPGGRPPPP